VAQERSLLYDQALAHYEIGRHLTDDDPLRRKHLQQALEIFDQLGAIYDRSEVQSTMDRS
jgi:flagellin-specific chaperone FliS